MATNVMPTRLNVLSIHYLVLYSAHRSKVFCCSLRSNTITSTPLGGEAKF